jgi:hypothetical protein
VHDALRRAESADVDGAAGALRRYERAMRIVVGLLLLTAALMGTARYL